MRSFFQTATLAAVIAAPLVFANGKILSDSLVKNLNCDTLTRDNVLSQLQENAFATNRHLPVRNWSSGQLGQCWSLSHAQRLTFYLGRFDDSAGPVNLEDPKARDAYVLQVLQLYYGDPSTPLKVFPIGATELSSIDPFYKSLFNGIKSGKGKGRTFTDTIEEYQKDRFFRTSNLYLTRGDRARTESENAQTFGQLQQDVAKNRLPMIVVRGSSNNQHVVLVKKIAKTGTSGESLLTLYDSYNFHGLDIPNSGGKMRDVVITYNENTRQFYSPDVAKELELDDKTSPLGIFLVDEDDMDRIQDALYQYYKTKCGL